MTPLAATTDECAVGCASKLLGTVARGYLTHQRQDRQTNVHAQQTKSHAKESDSWHGTPENQANIFGGVHLDPL